MVKANKQGAAAVNARRDKSNVILCITETQDESKYSNAPEMTRKAVMNKYFSVSFQIRAWKQA